MVTAMISDGRVVGCGFFYPLALYGMWYLPSSVKTHINKPCKQKNRREACVFQKFYGYHISQ